MGLLAGYWSRSGIGGKVNIYGGGEGYRALKGERLWGWACVVDL